MYSYLSLIFTTVLAQINACITLNVHWSTGLAILASSAWAWAAAPPAAPKELLTAVINFRSLVTTMPFWRMKVPLAGIKIQINIEDRNKLSKMLQLRKDHPTPALLCQAVCTNSLSISAIKKSEKKRYFRMYFHGVEILFLFILIHVVQNCPQDNFSHGSFQLHLWTKLASISNFNIFSVSFPCHWFTIKSSLLPM